MALFCSKNNHDRAKQYQNAGPKLDLAAYLNGHITGSGIIQTRSGKVSSQFDFSANAHWDGDVGKLDEKMVYYSGKEDQRTWTIQRQTDEHYIATTTDVVGQADIYVSGNAMNWRYLMDVDVKGKTYRLSFDDWMYLMNDGMLINVNQFKKFGFNVGSLTLMMQKRSDDK